MTKYDWEMISNDRLRDRFGYSLSLSLYTMKVSIPFYVAEVSLDFFALFFILVAFIANLCEVIQNMYLQLIDVSNRVCLGNGEISPGDIYVIVSIYSMKLSLSFGFYGSTSQSHGVYRQSFHKKYALNILFLTQYTMFPSVALWPRRLPCTQAVLVQASADPFFFLNFFFWWGKRGLLLFVCFFFFFHDFCLFVCFSFIPSTHPLSELHEFL